MPKSSLLDEYPGTSENIRTTIETLDQINGLPHCFHRSGDRHGLLHSCFSTIKGLMYLFFSQNVIPNVTYCWRLRPCTTWDVWNPINNGINYQPQLVSRISAINSIFNVHIISTQLTRIRMKIQSPKWRRNGMGFVLASPFIAGWATLEADDLLDLATFAFFIATWCLTTKSNTYNIQVFWWKRIQRKKNTPGIWNMCLNKTMDKSSENHWRIMFIEVDIFVSKNRFADDKSRNSLLSVIPFLTVTQCHCI